MAHALLSPSSASRWLECTPSARLEAERPDKAGEAADEGTLAHKLSEIMLEQELGLITKTQFKEKLKYIEANKHYSDSMWEYCEQYKVYVMQVYNEAQTRSDDAVIVLEREIDLTEWVPKGFGTRDVAIVAAGVLDIIDLKYGKGVLVDAKDNKQMMLYGLGTLDEFDAVFDIDRVRMTIYQPRIDNYSTYEILADELRTWANDYLVPKAKQAWAGKGDFVPGKHCQFCKVKTTCKANAEYHMELAQFDFADPVELTDEQLADIFLRASMFKNWINAVEEDMLHKALSEEKQYPGLKLVQGRSNRVMTEIDKIKALFEKKKLDKKLYLSEPALLPLGKLEKNIGAAEFNKLAGKYIIKPLGKPALVPIDDKRAAYHSAAAASDDFKE